MNAEINSTRERKCRRASALLYRLWNISNHASKYRNFVNSDSSRIFSFLSLWNTRLTISLFQNELRRDAKRFQPSFGARFSGTGLSACFKAARSVNRFVGFIRVLLNYRPADARIAWHNEERRSISFVRCKFARSRLGREELDSGELSILFLFDSVKRSFENRTRKYSTRALFKLSRSRCFRVNSRFERRMKFSRAPGSDIGEF